MGVRLLEGVAEAERHDRQAIFKVCGVVKVVIVCLAIGILLALVDAGSQRKVARVLERIGQDSGLGKVGSHNSLVPLEPKVDDWARSALATPLTLTVEHLAQNRVRRATKVEVVAVVDFTQVVQLKDKVLGEALGAAPDDPSDTDGRHAVLVARSIDAESSQRP